MRMSPTELILSLVGYSSTLDQLPSEAQSSRQEAYLRMPWKKLTFWSASLHFDVIE